MKIRCISLWQPWAYLVAHGHKRVETRHWRCPLEPGSLLAIHAAKKWTGELAGLCLKEPFRAALASCGVPPSPHSFTSEDVRRQRAGWDLPFGAVTCVVRVGDCLPIIGKAKPKAGEKCVGFDEDGILRVWQPFAFSGQHGHSGDGYKQVAEHEAAFGNYAAGRYAWMFEAVATFDPAPERGRQSIWEWEATPAAEAAVAQLRQEEGR